MLALQRSHIARHAMYTRWCLHCHERTAGQHGNERGKLWKRETRLRRNGIGWMERGEKEVCWDGKLCIDEQLSSSLDVCSVFARTHMKILSAEYTRLLVNWEVKQLESKLCLLHFSQSVFRLDASKLLLHLQSADYKHIMISLKGMDGGAFYKKKAPKDEPSLNFPAFCLPERTLKHLITTELPISLTFDMLPCLSEGSWMMCV